MIQLMENDAALRSVLPADRDAVSWHAALVGEIGTHLSAAHAQLLARPERSPAGMVWLADGSTSTRYGELPEAARRQLDLALGATLSDIRRLAESGLAPAVRAAWPALRSIPNMSHVFAVDGRPVLAGWGHVSGVDTASAEARLARLDDGICLATRPSCALGGIWRHPRASGLAGAGG